MPVVRCGAGQYGCPLHCCVAVFVCLYHVCLYVHICVCPAPGFWDTDTKNNNYTHYQYCHVHILAHFCHAHTWWYNGSPLNLVP